MVNRTINSNDNEIIMIYKFIGSIIPMVLIIRNNVLIYLNLRDTRQIERNKTAAVLCVTLLVFSICRIPHIVINIFELIYLQHHGVSHWLIFSTGSIWS